jgi:outer membrane immunogenic protein
MRRSLLLAAICAVGFVQAASAADLPTKAPAYAAPYNWNGFYVGGNLGWGWAPHNSDAFTDAGVFVTSVSSTRDGFLGGGQVGYNYMAWPHIVLGIEADFSAADIKATSVSTTATGTSSTSSKDDWFGTMRGRVGYAFDNWLLYGTGGFAWMHDTSTRTVLASVVPALVGQSASASSTLTGWTVGGGVEVGITANWIARLEYLHMDFASYTDHFVYVPATGNRTINEKLTADIVRVAMSYKFN